MGPQPCLFANSGGNINSPATSLPVVHPNGSWIMNTPSSPNFDLMAKGDHATLSWLSQFSNGGLLAKTLLEQGDVFSLYDLGVRIFLEETRLDCSQLVPAEIKHAFHGDFGMKGKGLCAGNTIEQMFNSFWKMACQDPRNKSLFIGIPALAEALADLGQGPSLDEVYELVGQITSTITGVTGDDSEPLNKNAQISFVEYCRFVRLKSEKNHPSFKNTVRKLFLHYDRDANGVLDLLEVQKFLRYANFDVDAAAFIACADQSGKGTLNFEDMYKFLSDSGDLVLEQWKVLKIWMQFSSGCEVTSKDFSNLEMLKRENPNFKIVTFIRHGQSDGNRCSQISGSCKGCFNPYITPLGVTQARARGQKLNELNIKFDLVVVSPMKRTVETFYECLGNIIDPSVPVIGHPLAREQFTECDDIGDPPILIKREFPKIDWTYLPDSPEVWWYPGEQYKPEDIPNLTVREQRYAALQETWNEPWADVIDRAARLEAFLASRPEQNICVFSHGGFIEALVGPRMLPGQACVLKIPNHALPNGAK